MISNFQAKSILKIKKVTITECNACPVIRWLLIVLISCVFLFASSATACYAQEASKDISASFIKTTDSLKTTDLYLNVLKVTNNTTKEISGNVSFTGPENWKIISFPTTETTILPGDTAWIPVRISPAVNAIGGISYIVSGTFKTASSRTTANTYLTLPSDVKWDFAINKNSIYFTEYSPHATFEIYLSNKGNTNELIKLHFDLGKLLSLSNSESNEYDEYISLPAFKDTIISQSITYKNKLSYSEKIRYERNWKESALRATASSESATKSAVINFNKLNSTFINQRDQNSSPLNIDYQLNNLMSTQAPSSNLRVFGNVLFHNNREIQYYAGVYNLNNDFKNVSGFDLNQQLLYSVRYADLRNSIELGYNIFGGDLHTVNGRGLMGDYKLNAKSTISYTLTQNPYTNNLGGHLGFNTSLGSVRFNTDLIHEENILGNYSASSVSAGVGLRILKHHSVSLQLLGSQANYHQPQRDTSLLGFSYRLNYSVQLKKFEFRASGVNSVHNYIKNSGMQQYNLDSKYTLNDKTLFIFYGNRQYYSTTRYPYNFDNPVSFNSSDYLRLTTSISNGNITYQLGPDYNGSMRQVYNSIKGFKSEYRTYQPGVWGAVSIKLDANKTLTPNVTVSNLRFQSTSQDPAIPWYSSNKDIYYSAGINYFDNTWRLNAYYTSGSIADLYRSIQINAEPVMSRSIQFRPSYENYFFNQKAKLSLYINYAYYMPSGRENISYNFKYDHIMKKGWTVSVSGFLYSNSITDQEVGKISTKDLNFIIGFRKSFNIQQPRLKYYSFKTVFFNDLDGNLLKSNSEPPVSNVLIQIEKNRDVSKSPGYIPETELISDINGEINIENLPKDNYQLQFTPLVNLKSLYFLNGSNQLYFNDKDRTLFVPLTESYKIKGQIILLRDENSSEGKIQLSGIRLTATGQKGETYSALTDNFGTYILNVPNANKFKVHVNNVFGEQFRIDTDEMEVQFTQSKTINLDFTFMEKKRGIEFENGNEIFKFGSMNAPLETPAEARLSQSPTAQITTSYAIQLATLKSYRAPSFFKNKFKLKNDVLYSEKEGEYKYYTGDYKTKEEARAAIAKLGVSGFAVVVDLSQLKIVNDREDATKVESNMPPVKVKSAALATAPSTGKQPIILKTESPVTRQSYAFQLDALKTYRDPSYYQNKYKLKEEVLYSEKDGEYKYYTGEYPSLEAAKVDNANLKLKGFAVAVDRNNLKKALPEEKTVSDTTVPSVETDPMNEKTPSYSIQLDALKTFRDPEYYKFKYRLKEDVMFIEKEGEYKYYTGNYSSIDAARGDIAKYGLSGYIVQIDRALLRQ